MQRNSPAERGIFCPTSHLIRTRVVEVGNKPDRGEVLPVREVTVSKVRGIEARGGVGLSWGNP